MEKSLDVHCSVQTCKTIDFLPFTCDLCSKQYCLDHRTYNSHQCSKFKTNVVTSTHFEDTKQFVCSVKQCKKRELQPVFCKSCRRQFCLRHRLEQDHDCTKQKVIAQSWSQPHSMASTNTNRPSNTYAKPLNTTSKPKPNSKAKAAAAATTTTIVCRLPNGTTVRNEFGVDTSLQSVLSQLTPESLDSTKPFSVRLSFPNKKFSEDQLIQSLSQLGLVPSSTLIVEQQQDGQQHKQQQQPQPHPQQDHSTTQQSKSWFSSWF